MVEIIEPNILSRHLYRIGPYIYFFKAENDDTNLSIVKLMNEEATKYPKLRVFQINWEKQLLLNYYTNKNYKNTIFLFFRGKSILEIFEPNKNKIIEIFKIGFEYYKKRLEIRFQNQGGTVLKNQNDSNISIENPEKTIKYFDKIRQLFYRKRTFAKEWKKLDNNNIDKHVFKPVEKSFEDLITEPQFKIENYSTEDTFYVKKLVLDQIKKSYSENTSIKNTDQNDKWFQNVSEKHNLPVEILNNPTAHQSTCLNDKKECKNFDTRSNMKNITNECPQKIDSLILFNDPKEIKNLNYKLLVKPKFSDLKGIILPPMHKDLNINLNKAKIELPNKQKKKRKYKISKDDSVKKKTNLKFFKQIKVSKMIIEKNLKR